MSSESVIKHTVNNQVKHNNNNNSNNDNINNLRKDFRCKIWADIRILTNYF